MDGSVAILDGSCFVVSDELGDLDARPDEPEGLFFLDTRYLSRWKLSLNGHGLEQLSTDETHYFTAQFFLVPPTGTVYKDPPLSVVRRRAVGEGFHEELVVLNHGGEAVELSLRIDADADFADLFEVKDNLTKKGQLYRRVEDGQLVLGYQREQFVRETTISATAPETEVDESGLTFRIWVPAKGEWRTEIDVVAASNLKIAVDSSLLSSERRRPKYGSHDTEPRPNMGPSLSEWLASAPRLATDWEPVRLAYRRSLLDLAALRFYSEAVPGGAALPAAGLPWFMAIFGRDSIVTSLQTLPYLPELAEATLKVLAARQALFVDDFRDAEPGKIMHEARFGELTAFEERPHSPYYGSCDATPLYLVLLDEYHRWTGDVELVEELEDAARAALSWIDKFGDRDGDGFVEYERRNTETGLENQCWKDSWDSILFRDGTVAKAPIATCEIQGYVYDAKVRCARIAREIWGDEELAARLEKEALELRRRFDDAFWLPERGFYALALDRDKRQVDSLTSNIGHLLWSGIVPEERAESLAEHLLGEPLFSGWGVRTMATTEGGYNPIRYHDGTVWPHDNSLIALGLTRYGFREQAARIADAIIDAASYFEYRLPEVFAGYPRSFSRFPVEYPTACSPQAWAAGTPLALITALLALEPDVDGVRSQPVLPEGVAHLDVLGVKVPRVATVEPVAAGPIATPADYFARVAARRTAAIRHGHDATYRFDLGDAGSWLLELRDGKVQVRKGIADADLSLHTDEQTFMRIVRGEQNAQTAVLSGQIGLQGQVWLAQQLVRILAAEAE